MIVYRLGNLTAANFTPRPDRDTVGGPGRSPGLSTVIDLPTGRKAQAIETSLLRLPLVSIPDDPALGGEVGHVAIAPISETGAIDEQLLQEWAASRSEDVVHSLTQSVLDAVVDPNVWRES
jgi:hypothetical protein